MVDFGSHTTRAGYAGEDCPSVVCPSFYGYIDESESSTSASNGNANGNGQASDAMDVDGAAAMNGSTDGRVAGSEDKGKGKSKGRKYFVGDDGAGIWRKGMEVDNFMVDGVGESAS